MGTVSLGRRIAIGVCIGSIIAFGAPDVNEGRPGLSFAAGVPADLRQVATETWERFVAAFPNQRSCMAAVTVTGAWSFEDRAAYRPDRRLVTVRIPATRPNLEAALVHEFAHHLEFTCPQQRDVRREFLAAQGFSVGANWWSGGSWAGTPSEQFAEAAVVAVLGARPIHLRIGITSASLRVLREWAGAP